MNESPQTTQSMQNNPINDSGENCLIDLLKSWYKAEKSTPEALPIAIKNRIDSFIEFKEICIAYYRDGGIEAIFEEKVIDRCNLPLPESFKESWFLLESRVNSAKKEFKEGRLIKEKYDAEKAIFGETLIYLLNRDEKLASIKNSES